jgi:DNA-binding NarL/FixJ family response regulator
MEKAPVFLLVEPSPILRSSMHDWLDRIFAGHRVLTAANGAEALKFADEERPSHILIEIELPEQNGLEVLQTMRKILPEARIVVTGWYESQFLLQSISSAGADGFIRKNKLPSELFPLWGVSIK